MRACARVIAAVFALGFILFTSLPAWKPPLLGVGMKSGRR